MPVQVISNGEFLPAPQGELQKQFEARLKERADALANRRGLTRRSLPAHCLGNGGGVPGDERHLWSDLPGQRSRSRGPRTRRRTCRKVVRPVRLDVHTHFLKDDTRLQDFVDLRTETGRRGYDPELVKHKQTFDDVKFPMYVKEIFLDSDTKIAVLSGAPRTFHRAGC